MEKIWNIQYNGDNLINYLNLFKKSQLEFIKFALNIDGKANYKKNELINLLNVEIPKNIYKFLLVSNSDLVDLISDITKNNGYLEIKQNDLFLIIGLKVFGITFPVIKDNKKILLMPQEILNVLKFVDFYKIKETTAINDKIITYASGLTNLYGVLEINTFYDFIVKHESEAILNVDVLNVLNNATIYNNHFTIFQNYVVSNAIDDLNSFITNLDKYRKLPYYNFSKKEILKAAKDDYLENNQAERNLISYITTNYDIPLSDAVNTNKFLVSLITLDFTLEELFDAFSSEFEINVNNIQVVNTLILDLFENTRLWTLKGHKRKEVKDLENKSFDYHKFIKFPNIKK